MSAPRKAARPWGDYVLRVFACLLLLGSGFSLLASSPFAMRMRNDVPAIVPGLDGVRGLAFLVAAALAFAPLLFGRRFLAAFLVSGFLLSGIGAYWWTLIPWDELLVERNFPAGTPPSWWHYFQVASPLVAALLYVVASRASRMRAEYANRGADAGEVSNAAAASFLAGMGVLVATLGLAGGFWWLLASGALLAPASWMPQGIVAVALAAALVAVAWALSGSRAAEGARGEAVTRPSSGAGGFVARVRSLARRSPS